MTEAVANDITLLLNEKFDSRVTPDSRPGYSGYIVPADLLLAFCTFIKQELGYDYLSSVTGVDYYPDPRMEVVYHLYKTSGGPVFNFKVTTDRENSSVPSVVSIYPGAEFQEREAWDLLGIRFEGHPDLRRILMWEGFNGHPLRKDWHEAYYEEDVKPLKSRWPDGHASHAEDKNPFKDNISLPPGFNPDNTTFEGEDPLYKALLKTYGGDKGLKTDQIIVNLGPQHPSTHGVFRMAVVLEGETIIELKPVMGYLHRNHEKIGERNTYLQNMPYTDRLDYISSMSNNFGYALTVEKLMGIKPPERAEYIRVIMAELTRISNHLMNVGFLMNDLGAFFTPALYGLEERELILDIFEAVSGSRMMCNYFRFGGVFQDLNEQILAKIKALVEDRLPRKVDDIDRYLTNNEILLSRCRGVGVLTREQAIGLSATGPILRSAGVKHDLRKADPYSIYDRFDFDIPVGTHGDVYDRYMIRLEEVRQSLRIIKQALKDIPEGPFMTGKPTYLVRVPAGESYGHVEGPKGELGYYVVSNGKPNPFRYHVRAPSFINLTSLAKMCVGEKVADVIVILGAIDIILGEVDR
jgi:NADH-quinone oxidoreductase subunit C/D